MFFQQQSKITFVAVPAIMIIIVTLAGKQKAGIPKQDREKPAPPPSHPNNEKGKQHHPKGGRKAAPPTWRDDHFTAPYLICLHQLLFHLISFHPSFSKKGTAQAAPHQAAPPKKAAQKEREESSTTLKEEWRQPLYRIWCCSLPSYLWWRCVSVFVCGSVRLCLCLCLTVCVCARVFGDERL